MTFLRELLVVSIAGVLTSISQVKAETILQPIVVEVHTDPGVNTRIDSDVLVKEAAKNTQVLFDHVPGVHYSNTGYGQLGDLEIRGMGGMSTMLGTGSDRVTLEIDGMEISQSLNFGHSVRNGRQYFDPVDLKRVEIQKGPGADGLAGNVRFMSKDPEDYIQPGNFWGGEVRAGYSGDSEDVGTGASVAGIFAERHSASISYNRHDFQELNNKGGRDVDGSLRTRNNPQDGTSHSLNSKYVYDINAAHRLTAQWQHFAVSTDTDVRSATGITSSGGVRTTAVGNVQSNRRDALSLRHDMDEPTALFDHMHWQMSAQHTQSEGKNSTTTRNAAGVEQRVQDDNDFRINTFSLKSTFEKALGTDTRHDLTYGAKITHSKAELNGRQATNGQTQESAIIPDSTQWQFHIHAADQISWDDSGFTLTPSLTLTHIRTDAQGMETSQKTALGGGLRAEYSPDEHHLFAASYQRAIRMPTFGEAYVQDYGHWLGRPNPDLEAETADGIELSWQAEGAQGKQKTTLFYDSYNNLIEARCDNSFNANGYCDLYNEAGRSNIYGVEIEGELNLGSFGLPQGLRAEGAIAWYKGENSEGEPLGQVDPLNGHIALRYDTPDEHWGAKLRLNFASAKKARHLPATQGLTALTYAPLPGYGVIDLTAYYRPSDKLTISGGIYNLTDKPYARWDRARHHGGDYTLYGEAGRYAGVHFRYQF